MRFNPDCLVCDGTGLVRIVRGGTWVISPAACSCGAPPDRDRH